jgi:hypothetical protein
MLIIVIKFIKIGNDKDSSARRTGDSTMWDYKF